MIPNYFSGLCNSVIILVVMVGFKHNTFTSREGFYSLDHCENDCSLQTPRVTENIV